jgi:hypothetical protein
MDSASLATKLFVFACVLPSPAWGQVIAHWRLQDKAAGQIASVIADTGPNNIIGTAFGNPIYTATGGCNSIGLLFDGVNDRIQIPDSPVFAISGSMTVEAWVREDRFVSGCCNGMQIVMRADDRPSLDPWQMGVGPNGVIAFAVTDALDRSSTVVSSTPLPSGVMVHVAAVLDDSANQLRFYMNGVLTGAVGTLIRPMTTLTGPNPGIGIGNVQSGTYSQHFAGVIDEVRITAAALTPDQFLYSATAPNITDHPTSTTFAPGANATFSVTATGGNLSFAWRHDGVPLTDDSRIQGAHSQTLTINNLTPADQGEYDCVVSAGCGGTIVSNSAALSCKPVIATQPPLFTTPRTGMTLAVEVPPGAKYTFRWRQNGQSLFNLPGLLAGVTTPTLTLLSNDPSLRGTYDCVLTNVCGSTTSRPTSLCAGDLDGNRLVDDADFSIFALAYDMLDCADPSMLAGCPADLNGDGFVDDADFQVFVVAYDTLLCS